MLFKLAGNQFRPIEAQLAAKALEPGDDLLLEREPSNPYDENAIRVYADDEWIGFIGAKSDDPAIATCADLAAHMDADERTEMDAIVWDVAGAKFIFIMAEVEGDDAAA